MEEALRVGSLWDDLTMMIVELKSIEPRLLQNALRQTKAVLDTCQGRTSASKAVCRMLLSAEEFLHFATMMEEKEKTFDFYHYKAISCLLSALKNGFFEGEYYYPLPDGVGERVLEIDLANNGVITYFATVKSHVSHAAIRLL